MSSAMPPLPPRRPPRGVPRWLWPPPGAEVRRVVLRERRAAFDTQPVHDLLAGEPVEELHWRALTWLLDEYPHAPAPEGVDFEGLAVVEIARTVMAHGRIGHAYALDGGPLGAPGAAAARGLVLRFAAFALRG